MLAKTLGKLLTEFGKTNNLTTGRAFERIDEEVGLIKKDLKGPDKVMATKFVSSCKKYKDKKEILEKLTETYFKLQNMGSDDF